VLAVEDRVLEGVVVVGMRIMRVKSDLYYNWGEL
jgi:hypothetical protein